MSSIDVIVPCYGYARYLRECVTSVLTQSVPDIRVLIINDASPDNTSEVAAELLKEDSRVHYLEHSANKGHISTYNEGIEWASADYSLLLSADDYLLPGALERAVSLMERHPDVGLAFGNAIELDKQGGQKALDRVACDDKERIMAGLEFMILSGTRNIVPTPTAVVRTALQKHLGGYREELPHAGDMELWLRLAAHSSVGFVKSPQAVYRRHASNMSLSYTVQCYLPDIEQRKTALDCLFATCGQVIPKSEELHSVLLNLLSVDAVSLASTAFNNGDLEAMDRLCAFAIQTSPAVKKSWTWTRLAIKRCIGVKAWTALRPFATGFRAFWASVQFKKKSSSVNVGSNCHRHETCSGESRLSENKDHTKKIWIDLDNSPHVPFFAPIIDELERQHYQVILTGRRCFQVSDLVRRFHLKCKIVGRHYGRNTLLKVLGMLLRSVQLIWVVALKRPDVAVSHGSRSQSLACKILRVPNLVMCDYEHSRLIVRPDWLLVPEIVARRDHRVSQARLLSYPGIKEDVYVPTFTPDENVRTGLGLGCENIIVTVRPPAEEAHYHNSESDDLYRFVIDFLISVKNVQVVLLPRTPAQAEHVRLAHREMYEKGRIVIPQEAVDGLSLLWYSDVVISGGGTINREAAVLKVPVYSIFKGKLGEVDRHLVEIGALRLLESVDDIRSKLVVCKRSEPRALELEAGPALRVIVDTITSIATTGIPNVFARTKEWKLPRVATNKVV